MSLTIVGQLGAWPVLQTYTSELFPTGLRSSASAWANAAGVIGRSASLAVAAPLLAITSQSMTATLLGIGPLIAIVMFALLFPDTHGRELEDVTGEDLARSLDRPEDLWRDMVIATIGSGPTSSFCSFTSSRIVASGAVVVNGCVRRRG